LRTATDRGESYLNHSRTPDLSILVLLELLVLLQLLELLVLLPFPGIVSRSDLQARNLRALVARTG
jgi:hypothetical protein